MRPCSTLETLILDRVNVLLHLRSKVLQAQGETRHTTRQAVQGGRQEAVRTRSQVESRQPRGWRMLRSQRLELQSMIAMIMCLWKCCGGVRAFS